jgi:hypothetical protein
MLLVHLHYPSADTRIGRAFARCKRFFAIGELFSSPLSDQVRQPTRNAVRDRMARAGVRSAPVSAAALKPPRGAVPITRLRHAGLH